MNTGANISKNETETIFAYHAASGEMQIIVPKRENDKYLTTEKLITLDHNEIRRLYSILKDIFEQGV